MIALEAVGVRLGAATVVDGVTFTVPAGGWTILIGPNGAGKTSLLRAVAGLADHSGSIRLRGREVSSLGARERGRMVAMVPQAPILPAAMTVAEYVRLGRTPYLGYLGRPGARDARAADAAIGRLELVPLAARRLQELSGGERQRAVLARALAQGASLLLLDEPTTALDIGRQHELLELVSALRAERALTVLAAMHDLTLAGRYAEHLVLLDGGRIAAEGPSDRVLTEELIGRHYRVRVRVEHVGGTPVVMPIRPEVG